MIIGISGKIASGKDTVAKIIQYLWIIKNRHALKLLNLNPFEILLERGFNFNTYSDWQVKHYADKLKDFISSITGISREELDTLEGKNKILGEEWVRYGKADGFFMKGGERIMNNVTCTKEEYEIELKTNWQTAYKAELTPRILMQEIGTNVCRMVHPNLWVNALFADYHCKTSIDQCEGVYGKCSDEKFPNWIIADVRYPNELDAIIKRGGIDIRIERDIRCKHGIVDIEYRMKQEQHSSETSLDNTTFKYTIENNGTIDELIEKVKEILIAEKII